MLSEASNRTEVWALDVSTSWHHRGMPPVGITRTEIEYARYICQHHANTLLTVYDRSTQSHLILPKEEAEEVLGIAASSRTTPARPYVEHKVDGPSPASRTALPTPGTFDRLKFYAVVGTLLCSLALLPSRSSADRRLRRHLVQRLTQRGRWRSHGLRGAVERWLLAHPSRAARLDFSRIDKYISVGCGWDMNNLEAIYQHKKRHGFSVVTCLYDLVPVVMPDVVAPRLGELFLPYLCNSLRASDTVSCISESTQHDVEAFMQGTAALRPNIEVCRLGSAPETFDPDSRPAVVDHLIGRPFALYVATIEPRKNHEFVHFLWNELVRRGRIDPIPLVLAGRPGWRTENLVERMRLNTKLYPEHLVLAEGLSDAEIAWLYRHCRFTVFPSLYEGWGLPVSESLFHGKFCIAADNSSLREAGQGLIRHIELLDGCAWMAEIERCISDNDYLLAREERIKRGFKARSWQEAAAEFFSLVCRTGRPRQTSRSSGLAKAA